MFFFILRAIEGGSSFVLQGNIFYIVLHIQDVAVYIPPNDEQPINQLRCDPHSGNLLMLVREAPACGSHIKNVQHKEQITPANIFYIVLHIFDVAVYISLKNEQGLILLLFR